MSPTTSPTVAPVSCISFNFIPLLLPTHLISIFFLNANYLTHISDDSISDKQPYGSYLFHAVKEKMTCLTICIFSLMVCIMFTGNGVSYCTTYHVANNQSHCHASELHKHQLPLSSISDMFNSIFHLFFMNSCAVQMVASITNNNPTVCMCFVLSKKNQCARHIVGFCVIHHLHYIDRK